MLPRLTMKTTMRVLPRMPSCNILPSSEGLAARRSRVVNYWFGIRESGSAANRCDGHDALRDEIACPS
jgi:hypothetical protein